MPRSLERYRPPLLVLLLLANLGVLALPITGTYLLFRLYEDTALVRDTEGQLIVQGTLIAALYKNAFERHRQGHAETGDYGLPVAAKWQPVDDEGDDGPPIRPSLSRLRNPVHPPVADSQGGGPQGDATAAQIGQEIMPLLVDAKKKTRTAIKVVDFNGTVVADSEGTRGASIAGRDDVGRALAGEPVSLLREPSASRHETQGENSVASNAVDVFVNIPIVAGQRVLGAVVLTRMPPRGVDALRKLPRRVIEISIVLLVLVVLFSVFTAVKINRPVRAIIEQTRRKIRDQNVSFRLLERPVTREIAKLSSAVSTLVEELEKRADYSRNLASHVSHEFKTPLSSIRGATELLRDHTETMSLEERKRFIAMIDSNTRRLDLLVERLLELTQADLPNVEHTDSADPLAVLRLIQSRYTPSRVSLESGALLDDTRIAMAEEFFDSIITSLIDNARQHGGSDVHVVVKVHPVDPQAAALTLDVSDNGQGVSQANAGRIFEHFFTTARPQGNTGLGLSIVKALLEAHDGSIRLAGSKAGTRFQIEIPLTAVQQPARILKRPAGGSTGTRHDSH